MTVKTILVVEHNPLDRRLLKDVLSHYGYGISEALNGNAAIEAARATTPDLIVMDVRLPESSGLQVARALKEDPQTNEIPIIAVTGLAMPGDERRILDSGYDAYLSKPYELTALLRLIETFLFAPPARGGFN